MTPADPWRVFSETVICGWLIATVIFTFARPVSDWIYANQWPVLVLSGLLAAVSYWILKTGFRSDVFLARRAVTHIWVDATLVATSISLIAVTVAEVYAGLMVAPSGSIALPAVIWISVLAVVYGCIDLHEKLFKDDPSTLDRRVVAKRPLVIIFWLIVLPAIVSFSLAALALR